MAAPNNETPESVQALVKNGAREGATKVSPITEAGPAAPAHQTGLVTHDTISDQGGNAPLLDAQGAPAASTAMR